MYLALAVAPATWYNQKDIVKRALQTGELYAFELRIQAPFLYSSYVYTDQSKSDSFFPKQDKQH